MAPGPTVRRRRLGAELRRLREARSFTLEHAAGRLGLAPSTLSRIETGKAPTRPAYLLAMLDMYGVSDPAQRQVLADMAREGHLKGWWAAFDDVLPTGFGVYVGLEAEASTLLAFENQVVHGLLQTHDYARAVMTAVLRRSPAEIDRLVSLRVERQQVLRRDPPLRLALILDEAVVRRPIGGPDVMRAQLDHLLAAARQPHVTLQILPFSAGAHPALNGPFCVLGFPDQTDSAVVYTEGAAGHAYLEKDPEVRWCTEAFALLSMAALTPRESAGTLSRAAARWAERGTPADAPAQMPGGDA